ncbi:MAG: hypothetical protein WCG01_02385 [bacterium]
MANDKEKQADKNPNEGESNGEKGSERAEVKEKPAKSKLVKVVFNKSHTPYLKGEVAGFEPVMANKLIEEKICSKA